MGLGRGHVSLVLRKLRKAGVKLDPPPIGVSPLQKAITLLLKLKPQTYPSPETPRINRKRHNKVLCSRCLEENIARRVKSSGLKLHILRIHGGRNWRGGRPSHLLTPGETVS